MSDYKNTLNLPETGFPMRGDLAKREPEMLSRWYKEGLYQYYTKNNSEIKKAVTLFNNIAEYNKILKI